MKNQLDAIDWQILSILATDGRASNVEIARRLGTSDATVYRRIQSLMEQGVMRVVAVADLEQIGLSIQVILGIDAELAKGHDVAEAVAALSPVGYLAYTTGRYDFIAIAYFGSEQELFHFLTNELSNIPGVQKTETLRVMKVPKRLWHFLPDVLEQRTDHGPS